MIQVIRAPPRHSAARRRRNRPVTLSDPQLPRSRPSARTEGRSVASASPALWIVWGGLSSRAVSTLEAAPLDAGWTSFEPSADTRRVYISRAGDDSRDGHSPATLKRTLAAGIAFLRHG